jgi:hypothetical protein
MFFVIAHAVSIRSEEYILDPALKRRGDFKGKGKAGIVLFRLDSIHGLAGNPQPVCQFALGHLVYGTPNAQFVLHQYRRVAK